MTKTTILYATFDGVATMKHGIGTQARAFISAVSETLLPADTDIMIAFPEPQKRCAGYEWSSDTFEATGRLCRDAGIKLLPLSFSSPEFWTQEAWIAICSGLIEQIRILLSTNERVIVLAVDAVYLPLSTLMHAMLDKDEATEIVHVLYSSARVQGATTDVVREAWEQLAIDSVNTQKRVYVANIGTSFTVHLRKAYGLTKEPLPFLQSVALDDPELTPYDRERTNEILAHAGVPTARHLVVAAGRSDPIKGLQDLARAMPNVTAVVLYVIIAVPYHADDPHLASLELELAKSGCEYLLFTEFDRPLLRALSSNPSTISFVVPSRGEPVGMAPQEVASWARAGGPIVLASDCDGLSEQIDDGQDGLLFPPGDVIEIARAIDRAVSLSSSDHSRLRTALWNRVVKERDFVKNLSDLLSSLNIQAQQTHVPEK